MPIYYITSSETATYAANIEASNKEEAENIFIRRIENTEPEDIRGFQIDSIELIGDNNEIK